MIVHRLSSRHSADRHLVYRFQVDMIADDLKCDFLVETDIPLEDFKSHVFAYLDKVTGEVKLIYKFAGESGRASCLDAQAFDGVMECICQKVANAHTQAVGLEVKNGVSVQIVTSLCLKLTITLRPNALPTSQRRGPMRTISHHLQAQMTQHN